MIRFRDLTANDIECRVQSAKQDGLILLLYKNARVDMNILDETVGAENWQREHYECKGNLFCKVGIYIDGKWVWKSDCGSESNSDAEKGEASDSFKRACFNWGIGRELYTPPFIWIKSKDYKDKTDKFKVKSITIVDKVITSLEIVNTGKFGNENNLVFTWKKKTSVAKTESDKKKDELIDSALKVVTGNGKTFQQLLGGKSKDACIALLEMIMGDENESHTVQAAAKVLRDSLR